MVSVYRETARLYMQIKLHPFQCSEVVRVLLVTVTHTGVTYKSLLHNLATDARQQ